MHRFNRAKERPVMYKPLFSLSGWDSSAYPMPALDTVLPSTNSPIGRRGSTKQVLPVYS